MHCSKNMSALGLSNLKPPCRMSGHLICSRTHGPTTPLRSRSPSSSNASPIRSFPDFQQLHSNRSHLLSTPRPARTPPLRSILVSLNNFLLCCRWTNFDRNPSSTLSIAPKEFSRIPSQLGKTGGEVEGEGRKEGGRKLKHRIDTY